VQIVIIQLHQKSFKLNSDMFMKIFFFQNWLLFEDKQGFNFIWYGWVEDFTHQIVTSRSQTCCFVNNLINWTEKKVFFLPLRIINFDLFLFCFCLVCDMMDCEDSAKNGSISYWTIFHFIISFSTQKKESVLWNLIFFKLKSTYFIVLFLATHNVRDSTRLRWNHTLNK